MPTHLALVMVVNFVKERKNPTMNGTKKAIMNARRVGKTKTGKYFFSVACMVVKP